MLDLRRNRRGSIAPFVALAILFIVGMMAITFDLSRDLQCVRQLEFAAERAAMYGLSQSTDADTSVTQLQNNISSAIHNATLWNSAYAGPSNPADKTQWSKPVVADDVQFVPNPANSSDPNDVFVQVTVGRRGPDSLTRFFVPMLYAPKMLQGGIVPDTARHANIKRVMEVVSQPASRIGPGPERGTLTSPPAGWATFPLALSNTQFRAACNVANNQTTYTVDFVSSSNPSVLSGHIAGCLTNVTATGDNLQYYGDGQGAVAYAQLDQSLQYFRDAAVGNTLAPGVVERGSKLAAYDPASVTFKQQQSQIFKDLNALVTSQPLHTFIVPVIAQNPNFNGGTINTVVGFARLQLVSFTNNGGAFSAVVKLKESVSVRNASCANGLACIPPVTQALMAAPVAPFATRVVDVQTQGMTALPHGLAMAPSLSPRWSLGYKP